MTVAERWFRTWPDSSKLTTPRVLARLLTPLDRLDELIVEYEALLGATADLRMPIPDFGGLELSAIDGLLLIASERPFTDMQRATRYSQIVPSLTDAIEISTAAGAEVVEPTESIVPGARARLRYPDGTLTELVEHRPLPAETAQTRPAPISDPDVQLLAYHRVHLADYDRAVKFYEQVLQTPEVPVSNETGPATRVGSLLLVAADTPHEDPPAGSPRAALWCEGARTNRPAAPESSARAELSQRPLVSLPGGLTAEVWAPRT